MAAEVTDCGCPLSAFFGGKHQKQAYDQQNHEEEQDECVEDFTCFQYNDFGAR